MYKPVTHKSSMSVELFYRYYGTEGKPPLVIIHGFMGSSRNWNSIAQTLSEHFDVFCVDLRNHGDSPHTQSMHFSEIIEDLHDFINSKGIDPAIILGHSLGGKVAMAYACKYPTTVTGLIVVDIAPKRTPFKYEKALDALINLDLKAIKTRKDADQAVCKTIPNESLRQFFLSSLARDKAKGFYWKNNLQVLLKESETLSNTPLTTEDAFNGPVMFIRGEHSDYLKEEDRPTIAWHFKFYTLQTVYDAGHNVHTDNKEDFLDLVYNFALHQLKCWL